MIHQVTTSDNEWCNKLSGMKTSDSERQGVTSDATSGTTSVSKWQLVKTNFLFFKIREEPTTKHIKENSLNLEENLEEELLI